MDHSTVLLHALLEAAANPDVSREALEEIAALGDDPERLASLVGPLEDDPEDMPIGKRYRGTMTKASAWAAYQGPRGGHGWRNTATGEVVYQDSPPGGQESPGGQATTTQTVSSDDTDEEDYEAERERYRERAREKAQAKLARSIVDDCAYDNRIHGRLAHTLHEEQVADKSVLTDPEKAKARELVVHALKRAKLPAVVSYWNFKNGSTQAVVHTHAFGRNRDIWISELTESGIRIDGEKKQIIGPDDTIDDVVGKVARAAGLKINLGRDITKSYTPDWIDADSDDDDNVDYSALAHWHARLFTMLEASGLEVTDEDIAEAESELDGTGWSVGRDDDGEWQARSTTSTVKKSWRWGVLEKAAQRAPAGYSRANPFHFNGRDYVGGQFIPGKAIETASEEDRAKLEQAKESEDRAAETKKQARGSVAVDPAALLESLKEHGGVELSKGDRGNAARAYAALKRHHGDLTLHRVAELAQRAQKALASIEDDNPNAEGLRSYWSKQLAVMSGWVERAQGEGMTGEARAAKIEEPVVTPELVKEQPASEEVAEEPEPEAQSDLPVEDAPQPATEAQPEPRPRSLADLDAERQSLMDDAVARAKELGRPFTEDEILKPVWDAGYEISPQMDRRFVLHTEATGTSPRLWAIQGHRYKAEKTPPSEPAPATEGAAPLTVADHIETVKALRSGQLTAQQIRDSFERLASNEAAIKAELGKRSIKELAPRGAGGLSKAKLIDAIFNQMLDRYIVGETLSWSPFSESKIEAQRRQLANLTDESLAEIKAKAQAAIEARDKALSNPETLEEFSRFVASKGEDALTPEQQARWDDLVAERRRSLKQEDEARNAVVQQVQGPEGLDMDIQEGFHAKKQQPVYVAVLNQRVERDKYKELESAAKRLGGYYSAFRGQGAIPGFQFPTKEAAERFRSALSGSVDLSGDLAARREAQTLAAADRLADRAEDISATAGDSLGRDRLANTARRARHAAAAEEDARREQAFAGTLANISEAIGSGQGKHLTGVRNAAQVRELERLLQRAHYDDVRARMPDERYDRVQEALAGQPADTAASRAKYPWPYAHKEVLKDAARKMEQMPGHKQVAARLLKQIASLSEREHGVTFDSASKIEEYRNVIAAMKKAGERYLARDLEDSLTRYNRIRAMGIESLPELRAALRQYAGLRSAAQKADPIKVKERALIGKPIPGFFPTPRPVIDRMLEAADIRPGMSVLEPSAGKGDIADAVRETSPEASLTAVEPVGELRDILQAKGHQVTDSDFLAHAGQYDRIVMNPPFENGQDADHVRHAYDQLKPGGKLVAVMSEGPFFRQDRKASEFRDWLSSVGGESEQMESAFAGRDAFRQTGVNTRMVVIEKPAFSGTLTDSQGRTYQFEDGKRVASPETQTPEPSTTNPVDTASVTQHNAPVSSGAQEQQAMTHTVYQGTGRASQGSIYSMGQGAVMDDADYYAFDEGSARGYGPDVKQTQVSLSNPAKVTSDIDWADLAKAAGVPQDLALMSAYGGDTSQVQAAKAKLRAYLVSQGHDGMVVQIDRSKPAKKVGRLFGHDQLVKFRDATASA